MNHRLPDLTKFSKNSISNYDQFQKPLLQFYRETGTTFEVTMDCIDWLINYRTTASLEQRNIWSDSFSAGETGDLALAEGCYTLLYILSEIGCVDNASLFEKYKSLKGILLHDLSLVLTGHTDIEIMQANIANAIINKDDHEIVFENIPTSYSPYYNEKAAKNRSTETIALDLGIITLYKKLAKNGKAKAVIEYFELNFQNWQEYLSVLEYACIDSLISFGYSHQGFGPYLSCTNGFTKERNMYSTCIAVRFMCKYYEENKDEINTQIKTKLFSALKLIMKDITDNRLVGGSIGWKLCKSQEGISIFGTVNAVNTLCLAYNTLRQFSPIDFANLDKSLREVFESFIQPLFNQQAKTPFFSKMKSDDLSGDFIAPIKDFLHADLFLKEDSPLVFSIDTVLFQLMEAIINYIVLFSAKQTQEEGLCYFYDKNWEQVILLEQVVMNRYFFPGSRTGLCQPVFQQGRYKTFVSLRLTSMGIQIFNRFGINKNAQTGIIDIMKNSLDEAIKKTIIEFYNKFETLEKMGYRIAWGHLESDYNDCSSNVVSVSESEGNEFDLLMAVENNVNTLCLDIDDKNLRAWKSNLFTEFNKLNKSKHEVSRLIPLIQERAVDLNKNIRNIVSKLVRINNPQDFRKICYDILNEYKVEGHTAIFKRQALFFDYLYKIESDTTITNHVKRLKLINELILSHVINEETL